MKHEKSFLRTGFLLLLVLSISVQVASAAKDDVWFEVTTPEAINIFWGPGSQFGIVALAEPGQLLRHCGQARGWYLVCLDDGKQGYVYSGWVKESTKEEGPTVEELLDASASDRQLIAPDQMVSEPERVMTPPDLDTSEEIVIIQPDEYQKNYESMSEEQKKAALQDAQSIVERINLAKQQATVEASGAAEPVIEADELPAPPAEEQPPAPSSDDSNNQEPVAEVPAAVETGEVAVSPPAPLDPDSEAQAIVERINQAKQKQAESGDAPAVATAPVTKPAVPEVATPAPAPRKVSEVEEPAPPVVVAETPPPTSPDAEAKAIVERINQAKIKQAGETQAPANSQPPAPVLEDEPAIVPEIVEEAPVVKPREDHSRAEVFRLARSAKTDPDEQKRLRSTKELGDYGLRAVPVLLGILTDGTEPVRAQAARQLGDIGGPLAMDGLKKNLADPETPEPVKLAIVESLSAAGEKEALALLHQELEKAVSPEYRAALEKAISELGE